MKPSITSEVGRLREVVVHRPGPEIESMTPSTAPEVLYNDIIPIGVVSSEHETLRAVLGRVAEVYELTDLVTTALADSQTRQRVLETLSSVYPRATASDLTALAESAEDLVAHLVQGLHAPRNTLSSVMHGPAYLTPPLPNLYFMRDSSLVIGESVAIGAMAHQVRVGEAVLLRAVFASHRTLFDGVVEQGAGTDVRLEGGDVLVARDGLLVVGISERTSSEALDELARRLCLQSGEPATLIAVVLPRERSTIHMDMIFTLVDADLALAYEPLVTGPSRCRVYSLRAEPDAGGGVGTSVTDEAGILEALERHGLPLQTIACGGGDPVVREREQWLSAANVFAIGPGKVIGYDCNDATMTEFDRAGFSVCTAAEFLAGEHSIDDPGRLFVGLPGINLARGGGGPRCMTLPVRRDPV